MQELELCKGIVEATQRRARGRRVSAVRVRVAGPSLDLWELERAFYMLCTGTVADGAQLEVLTEASTVTCEDCGAQLPPADRTAAGPTTVVAALVICPSCRSLVTQWAFHEGAVVESVTFAPQPTSACLVTPA